MAEKLGSGDTFPQMNIELASGSSLSVPRGTGNKYMVALFYRGHWWHYCRRQLAGYEKVLNDLRALDVMVFAASVDPLDKAREVANEVTFPIGYGMTRDQAESLGAWWEARRNIIQPSEFVLGQDGKVLVSSYSDGPLGRIDATDVLKMIASRENKAG